MNVPAQYNYSPQKPDAWIAGTPIWLPSTSDFIRTVNGVLSASAPRTSLRIFTLNPEMLMHGFRTRSYQEVLAEGNFNIADGIGVVLALRMRGISVADRLSGADVIHTLAAAASNADRAMLIIGGRPDRLGKACVKLRDTYPGLNVEGLSPPYKQTLPLPNEEEIRKTILSMRPGVVAVCLGVPKQEQWIVRNKDLLDSADVRIVGGFGGTADFLSGDVRRAPNWIRKGGLEWMFRLAQEPWRFKRQLAALPAFGLRALFDRGFTRYAP